MKDSREYAFIVEYSYNLKNEHFVVRFLDNNSYVLDIEELPKKMQTKNPDWTRTELSSNRDAIIVPVGKGYREIPFHIIHSRGRLL